MRKVFIYSVGCIENSLEGSRIGEFFRRNDWELTEQPAEADLLLVNTCGVIASKERQSVGKLSELQAIKRPEAKLVVCGCLPDINQAALEEIASDGVVTPGTVTAFNQIADGVVPIENVVSNRVVAEHMRLRLRGFHLARKTVEKLQKWGIPVPEHFRRVFYCFEEADWYYIKICSGCLHDCSFCAIKIAKGRLVSKPLEGVMAEFREGLKQGQRSFVLAGDDTGAYGKDLGSDLVELLERMTATEGDFEIYVRNFEPMWFIRMYDRLKPVLQSGKIRAVTLPVQTGSPRILRAMKRAHTIDDFRRCVEELHRDVPDLLIVTHLMVGFPGEKGDDFHRTLQLLSDLRFDGISPEQYHPRPGIASLELPEPVPVWKRRWRLFKMHLYVYYSVYLNKFYWKWMR